MANRVQSLAILSLLMILGVGIRAQSPQPTPQDANTKAVTRTKTTEGKVIPPQPVTNLQGFGTKGQIAKFGGGDFLINSLIFESFGGKIGVASNPPGVVKSLNGKTGDLTLQAGSNITITTSGNTLIVSAPTALSEVAHDATLTGNGTTLSPLSVVSTVPQGQPISISITSIFETDVIGINVVLTTVPVGKRLVIEHLSTSCRLTSPERIIELAVRMNNSFGSPTLHFLVGPTFLGATVAGGDIYQSSQQVKFYAESGPVSVLFSKNGVTRAPCTGALSGYLVDIP